MGVYIERGPKTAYCAHAYATHYGTSFIHRPSSRRMSPLNFLVQSASAAPVRMLRKTTVPCCGINIYVCGGGGVGVRSHRRLMSGAVSC